MLAVRLIIFHGNAFDRYRRAIEQSSLERTEHTKAGGLSGGEKRRLKVALELLMDRQILFLDEPTSGLDANSSLELVTILKRLSRKVEGLMNGNSLGVWRTKTLQSCTFASNCGTCTPNNSSPPTGRVHLNLCNLWIGVAGYAGCFDSSASARGLAAFLARDPPHCGEGGLLRLRRQRTSRSYQVRCRAMRDTKSSEGGCSRR